MVDISHMPCFCSDAGLERFTSKSGRGFVKCSTSNCTLFCPEEKYNELYQVYEEKVLEKFKPPKGSFPLCHCGDVASLWVSHSSANPMRPFFRCQEMDDDEKCEYFKWGDGSKAKRRMIKRKASQVKRGSKAKKSFKKVKRVKVSSDDEEEQEQE